MGSLSTLIIQAKEAEARYSSAKDRYVTLRRAGKRQRDCGPETKELGKASFARDQALIELALVVISVHDGLAAYAGQNEE